MKQPISYLLAILCVLLSSAQASAFCGMFVSDSSEPLVNDTTQVVLMRHYSTTVLSMRNTYQGPAEDFAMVVPVPVVLQESDVKILDDAVFDELARYTRPRLVAYGERDPCKKRRKTKGVRVRLKSGTTKSKSSKVEVAAEFTVGEYEVVILSAKESTALESWLLTNKYNIPKGGQEVLQSYIAQGMYFFVAKVNADKVNFDAEGRALLSPLRFAYDSEDFALPVRLGLLNASGPQDLIVHILARDRYQVANYPNAFVPTNLIVKAEVQGQFDAFYDALFSHVSDVAPGTVFTEYAWPVNDPSTKCDPCAGPSLTAQMLQTLGADIIGPLAPKRDFWAGIQRDQPMSAPFVVTRLHLRYTSEQVEQDLVFERAEPVAGGRGVPSGKRGALDEQGAVPHDTNSFQARYIILEPWEEPLTCKRPVRYDWSWPRGRSRAGDTTTSPDLSLEALIVTRDAPGLSELK